MNYGEDILQVNDQNTSPSRVRFHDRHRVRVPEVTNANEGKHAAILSPFTTFYEGKAAPAETEVSLAYNATHLLISIKAYHHVETESSPISDSLDVLLKPSPKSDAYYKAAIMLPGSSKPVTADWGPGCIELDALTSRITEGDGYWSIELAVSFIALNVIGIQPGEEWGFNIVRHAVGYRPASSWVPIRHAYFIDNGQTYSLKAVVLQEGRLGTLAFGGEPLPTGVRISELTYKGFHEKQLSFQMEKADVSRLEVRLVWRTPAGGAYRIDEVASAGDEGVFTVAFTHPGAVENGLYGLDLTVFGAEDGIAGLASISFDRIDLMEAGDHSWELHLNTRGANADELVPVEDVPASPEVQRLLGLIPDRTGILFAGLPDRPELWPYLLISWDPDNPDQFTSHKSPLAYPHASFPEDRAYTVRNPKGEEVRYPYHENEKGQKFFLSASTWYAKRDYVLEETEKLAAVDPLGAARLLYRFAQIYQGYTPVYDYPWVFYPMEKQAGPPYPYWGGMWNRWFYLDLYMLGHLFNAYGQISRTNAFQLLAAEVREDVRAYIVDRMFVPSVHFVQSYPIMNTNMDFGIWVGLASLGRALNDPRYIHEAIEKLKAFCLSQFLFDGFWKEVTLSYHKQTMDGLKNLIDVLEGWSDPEGYVSPRTGGRIDNLDLEKDLPFLKIGQSLFELLAYPTGRLLPVTDTWAYDRTEQPNTDSGSLLLPASGIGKMVLGNGRNQLQAYLTFVPKYGHNHLDPLNLVLFAHGQELLPDLGYTHTKYRYAAVSTLGHNTVVVDGADMDLAKGKHGGNIEVFTSLSASLQVTRANQENAYPGTDLYSRELWTIGFSDEDGDPHEGYVLDLFRVHGGSRHEYTLHGDADYEALFSTDLPLHPYGPTMLPPGVAFTEPELETETGHAEGHYAAYMFMNEVKSAKLSDGTYDLTLETRDDDAARAQLRILGNAGEDGELFVGRWPSLQATRLHKQDANDMAERHFAPHMIVRREGERLQSDFVTLLEPIGVGSKSRIHDVDVIRLPGQDQRGHVAVVIRHGTIKDIVLSTASPDGGHLEFGDIAMQGKLGFIRMEGAQIKRMMLLGGTLLQKGTEVLHGTGTWKGNVRAVLRQLNGDAQNAVIVDIPIPAQAVGCHLVVTHPDGKTHGYLIRAIYPDDKGTAVDLMDKDPGFTIHADGTSTMNYFPHTHRSGNHTFTIDSIAQKGE